MKLSQLIADLQAIQQASPEDPEVIYVCCSDNNILEPGQVELFKAEEKRFCLRAGRYIEYDPVAWGHKESPYRGQSMPIDEQPVFATVVQFPGN